MLPFPDTQTAILALEDGQLAVRKAPVSHLEPDQILVKTHTVALNPVDSKMTGKLATPGALAGFDFAGTVVSIGSSATPPTPLQIGDRVCGAVHGMHSLTPTIGAFAEYVCVAGHVLLRIPEGMSFEEAAGLGVGVGTVGLALFRSLGLPGWPERKAEKPVHVLVYGGSTASGTLAIQLLRLSGFLPITTCSPSNESLVISRGATETFDYHYPDAAIPAIKSHTKNSLRYALDCITDAESAKFCYACLGRAGGRYVGLEPPHGAAGRGKTVKADWVLFMDVFGKRIAWPPPFEREGSEADREWAVGYYGVVQRLLDNGELVPHPVRVVRGGFEGVLVGLEMVRNKEVSGEKLVCRMA